MKKTDDMKPWQRFSFPKIKYTKDGIVKPLNHFTAFEGNTDSYHWCRSNTSHHRDRFEITLKESNEREVVLSSA